MSRSLALPLTLFALLLARGPARAAAAPSAAVSSADKIFPFPTEVVTLPNGLALMFVTFDSPGLAAYYSLVRVGSRNEIDPGRSGFAHFFEHMMFRGTKRFPGDTFDQVLSRAGVRTNAFTTDDFTCYTDFGPSSALPQIVELEADRFRNLSYPLELFQTESRAVLGEYNKNAANPAEKMEEVLRDVAFDRHTYKHTTMGFKADIEAMPRLYDHSLDFLRRWYTPDNVTLLVVGDFDRGQVRELVERHYGDWKGKTASAAIPDEPRPTGHRAAHVTWTTPTQARLFLAWRTPPARPDTRDAALQNVLGPYLFGPTSPAYKDLILDRQLLTGLEVGYWDHRDPALFNVLATLRKDDDLPAVREALEKTVADLCDGKVDETRFTDIRSNQKYGLLRTFDSPANVAMQLAVAIGPTGEPRALETLFEHMDRLAPQDLAQFAKEHLVDAGETAVTLTGQGGKSPPGAKEYVPSAAARGVAPPPEAAPATKKSAPGSKAKRGGGR